MIVIVTRKEITMVARNTSELVDALNQEDEESLKILFSKSTIANMKQLRKNSLTNESIYTRTRRLIRYYYKNFINSKLPIFLCIIIYFLICGTGNLITGIIWFKYHNSPTNTGVALCNSAIRYFLHNNKFVLSSDMVNLRYFHEAF